MSRVRNDTEIDQLPASLNPDNIVAEHPWSLLSAIVDSCDDAIISKDLNGIITSWNPAATRIFGYSPGEIIGKSILSIIPGELHGEEAEILKNLRQGNRIEHHETVRVAKDGRRVNLEITVSPIRDGSGNVIGASKIAHDISERKLADETQSRLASIAESSDDAIISQDIRGIVTSWNESATRMFGFGPEEMIGDSILKIVPGELIEEEADMQHRLSTGERVDHFETTRTAKDGSRLQVSAS